MKKETVEKVEQMRSSKQGERVGLQTVEEFCDMVGKKSDEKKRLVHDLEDALCYVSDDVYEFYEVIESAISRLVELELRCVASGDGDIKGDVVVAEATEFVKDFSGASSKFKSTYGQLLVAMKKMAEYLELVDELHTDIRYK